VPDQLSSSLTFWYKIIFPSLWLSGFAAGSVAMLFTEKAPAIAFVCATVAGFFFLRHLCFPLKRVRQGSDGILVSNFSDEIFVPYAQIQLVDENKWINALLWDPFRFRARFRARSGFFCG
jgi:hypothetical protein